MDILGWGVGFLFVLLGGVALFAVISLGFLLGCSFICYKRRSLAVGFVD